MHRVDGRAYWFAAYFNAFDRARMIRDAGEGRADRFNETFSGRIPFPTARIVRVYDEDRDAAARFAETFGAAVAATPDEFADGLDGILVPFPSGGPRRDYAVTAPFARRGIPLFLDRIILEQREDLRLLMQECAVHRVPLHVTCFMRYLADLLLPPGVARAEEVTAVAHGEPAGYGADLLDLVDQLMHGEAVSVRNDGDAAADLATIRYADGRQARLHLHRDAHPAMTVTAAGDGWTRELTLDGSQFHYGAFRQFEAFLRSLDAREPPVPYRQVLANAAILGVIEARECNRDIPLG